VPERLYHLLKVCFSPLTPFSCDKPDYPWHSLLSFESLMYDKCLSISDICDRSKPLSAPERH
jgi:hypothetical protein